MKHIVLSMALLMILSQACHHTDHPHSNHEGTEEEHHHDAKISITAYSHSFELFAEADPFVVGHNSNILSHFSILPTFKALEQGKITVQLISSKTTINQTLDVPIRKGIYSFDIKPTETGKAKLIFEINNGTKKQPIIIDNLFVYSSEHEAHEAAEALEPNETNTSVFTKEQTWKIDYCSEYPQKGSFGQIIKTTALIESAQTDHVILSAKTNGFIQLSDMNLLPGQFIEMGDKLCSISGSELINGNISVKYAQEKRELEKAKIEYERAKALSVDDIISKKELLEAQIGYENSKASFEMLQRNFNGKTQDVISSIDGYIKAIYVRNGSYVETGQAIFALERNKHMVLHANVQSKYASKLKELSTATIITHNNSYTLEELNGHIISTGQSTTAENHLIPVYLGMDYNTNFTPGNFAEVYLKIPSKEETLSIPNSALLEDQGQYFAYVQITPELFEKRNVQIGASDGLRTEIISGLSKEERIVSQGAIFIKLSQSSGALDAHSGHVH